MQQKSFSTPRQVYLPLLAQCGLTVTLLFLNARTIEQIYRVFNNLELTMPLSDGHIIRLFISILILTVSGYYLSSRLVLLLPKRRQDAILKKWFESLWENWTPRQRLEFFARVHNTLAEAYQLDPSRIKVADLAEDDGAFKTHGLYRHHENKIILDIDKVDSIDGYRDLQTLIHETRHSIQNEFIDQYRQSGRSAAFPRGVTLAQVKAWSRNDRSYVTMSEDEERYLAQPLEQDARDFAEQLAPYFIRIALKVPVDDSIRL